jgi:CDP-4-dehydro-6-deoxyglucose reductase
MAGFHCRAAGPSGKVPCLNLMFNVTLSNGVVFEVSPSVSLLDGALAKGIILEHSCRTGRCGSCKALALHGSAEPLRAPVSLTDDEAARGWVLTCTHAARSDMTLDIADLGALADVPSRLFPARIAALDRLADDVLCVRLRLPPRAPLRFLAGQSVDVIGPSGARRSYSIASPATAGHQIELQIRRVDGGVLSAWWFEHAKVDDLLRFHGPRGTFFLRPVAGRDLVFLATGTGIAPILAMLAQVAGLPRSERPRSVSLYWGGRRRDDHYLDPTSPLAGVRHVPVVSRDDASWKGARGHVQDVLLHEAAQGVAPSLAGASVYACGSQAMIDGARALLADAGLPAGQFHFDAFVRSD